MSANGAPLHERDVVALSEGSITIRSMTFILAK
jgi:hypothetical protein